jgi:fatty-acyl-CoA synthase
VTRLAAGLQRIGVAEGEQVAVLVPINFMLKAEEVTDILRHASARALATDSGLTELARAAAALGTQVNQFVWLPSEKASEPAAGMQSFDELAACSHPLVPMALQNQGLAQIVHTSGTEASPKGAMQGVAVGEVGKIVHHSRHLMLGYFKDPECTAAAFDGG